MSGSLTETEDGKLALLPDAPPLVPDGELEDMPMLLTQINGTTVRTTHGEVSAHVWCIQQELARMMRRRGTSTPPPPETGGTPAAAEPMRAAA